MVEEKSRNNCDSSCRKINRIINNVYFFYDKGNLTSSLCESEDRSLSSYLFMFLFGQSLHGVSGTLLYTIAPPFIDGSVSNRASPLYIGEKSILKYRALTHTMMCSLPEINCLMVYSLSFTYFIESNQSFISQYCLIDS